MNNREPITYLNYLRNELRSLAKRPILIIFVIALTLYHSRLDQLLTITFWLQWISSFIIIFPIGTYVGYNHTSYNLNDIFSVKEQRTLNNDYTIVYQKRIFQLHAQQRTIILPKNVISVHTHLDGTIKLWARKTELAYHEIKATQKPIQEKKIVNRQPTKPCINSRRWVNGLYPLSSQESRVNARPAGGRGV